MSESMYQPTTPEQGQRRKETGARRPRRFPKLQQGRLRRRRAAREDQAAHRGSSRARDPVPVLHQGPHQIGHSKGQHSRGDHGGDLGCRGDASRGCFRPLHPGPGSHRGRAATRQVLTAGTQSAKSTADLSPVARLGKGVAVSRAVDPIATGPGMRPSAGGNPGAAVGASSSRRRFRRSRLEDPGLEQPEQWFAS